MRPDKLQLEKSVISQIRTVLWIMTQSYCSDVSYVQYKIKWRSIVNFEDKFVVNLQVMCPKAGSIIFFYERRTNTLLDE